MRDTIEEGSLKGALLTKLQPKDDDDSICQNTQIIQIHKETTPLQYDSLWNICHTTTMKLLFDCRLRQSEIKISVYMEMSIHLKICIRQETVSRIVLVNVFKITF